MKDVLKLIDEGTYQILGNVYHDMGSRVLLAYEDVFARHGVVMKATCGYRSIEDQNKLFAQGRTTPGPIVTYARGGYSWHAFGLAIDSCFAGRDPYLDKHPDAKEIWNYFGKVCTQNGLVWGGGFTKMNDKPHVEKHYDLTLADCREIWYSTGIPGLWNKIDARLESIHKKENLH